MGLETEILDVLEFLKYPGFGSIEDNTSLLTDVPTFSTIISWISNELSKIDGLESTVNPIKDESEMVSFKIELNSLLRELNSPLIDSDFTDSKTKLYLLNSICGHLMASVIIHSKQKSGSNQSMTISMTESQTAKDLKYMLIILGEKRKPPNNVSPELLFNIIKDLMKKKLSEQNYAIEDSLLLPDGLTLSPEQWKRLETINEELKKDYTIRRQMLLKRCECTVNSFGWRTENDSQLMKAKIQELIESKINQLSDTPDITIADALAARQSDCDSLINGVVSKNPTNCFIQVPTQEGTANRGLQQRIQAEELHKYRIGAVPDRGGRPNEQPTPNKESFAQQKFQRDNPQRGRGRGANTGGGGGRGGGGGARARGGPPNLPHNTNRIQGSCWAQNSGDRYSNDNQRRGEYQSNNYRHNDGQQNRRQQRDDYQQSSGYDYNTPQQQPQQPYNQNNQYYEQQYEKQPNHNYSDQSYDNRQYHNQSRPYRGRPGGGGGGGGGGRRY